MGSGATALIDTISTAPTEITPAKGLGARANCSIVLKDTADNDSTTDPYVMTRSYDPLARGTYWGKFLARNPHYYGRELRIKYGFLEDDDSLTSVETYTYLIDEFSFDNSTGKATLKGKDPLTFGDALKGKVPKASAGKLTADMTEVATSFTVTSGEGANYPSSGRVVIDKEIIEYTTITTDTFSGLTRGAQGTEAKTHSSGDTVQEVFFADNERVDLTIERLLDGGAGIPTSFLPTTDWDTEADQWLGAFLLSGNVTKPTEINKIIGELSVECGFALWSDDRSGGEIKLKAEAPLLGTELASAVTLMDKDIEKNSLKVSDDTKSRIGSVWYNHTLIDPTETTNKASNFAVTDITTNSELISSNAYNKDQIKEIYSDWVRSSTPAQVVSSRMLARFGNPPKKIEFLLDAKTVLSVGDHFFFCSEEFQDASGAASELEFQVTSIAYQHKTQSYKVKALQFRFSSLRQCFVASNSQADYTSASESEQLQYGFIADSTTLKLSNGDDPYVVI